MIVLHSGVNDGWVLLWGETSATSDAVRPARRRGRKPEVSHPPSLPYDSEARGLLVALTEAGFSFAADKKRIATVIAWMPTMDNQPVASSPLIAEPPKSRAKPILTPWTVTALPLSLEQAIEVLCACVDKQTLAPGVVGLNLTRANHVFHFDRWWNPAVENQATGGVAQAAGRIPLLAG